MRVELLEEIVYTNKIIRQDLEKNGGNNWFIDIYTPMLNEKGLPAKKFFKADGLHLNKTGYTLWKQEITRALFEKTTGPSK